MAKRQRLLALALASFSLWSCGGGSDGNSSAVEGTWKGSLYQGVISCSDGSSIGAGAGSIVRSAELEISGTDEIWSMVQVIDRDCVLQGPRDTEGFTAQVVSGCEQDLDNIRFNLISENEAGVSYYYDINKAPANQNGVRCKITPSGRINR